MAYNFTLDIEQDGEHIAAQIKVARRYEEAAEEKAGTDLCKAADNWTSVYQRLAAVRAKCKEAKVSFEKFKEQYCEGLGGRSKLYKALAIADGRTTEEQQREQDAKRQAAKRAKDEGVRDVTDSPTANDHAVKTDGPGEAAKRQVEDVIAKLPSSWETPEESSKARTVVYTKPELPERPRDTRVATAAPTVEPEDAPADVNGGDVVALDGVEQKAGNGPLEEFKRACNKWLPMMTEDERKQAHIHHIEWRPKLKRKAA
jgi:hypothetical protein